MEAVSNHARESSSSTDASTVLDMAGHENPAVVAPNAIDEEKTATTTLKHKIKAFFLGPSFMCTLMLIAAGSAVAFQSGANATMNHIAGRAFSSVVNFSTGSIACLLFLVIDVVFFRGPAPTITRLKTSPWYSWLGGILGTYYIVINILTVPKHGAGTVLSIFVCAQVIMACLMDHFGLTGISKRKFSVCRCIASLGLIGCVAVITLF